MKNLFIVFLAAAAVLASCKNKKKDPAGEKKYISVRSVIEEQIKHVDTSLYSIIKVTGTDSLSMDTVFVKREDFRQLAEEFMNITDLSDPENAKRFKEESTFDTLIRRVIITYTPIKPEAEELQKLQFLISQEIDKKGNNKIKTIIIDKARKDRNESVVKQLLWRLDKSFLITTTTQKPGEPEKISLTRVIWNEDPY